MNEKVAQLVNTRNTFVRLTKMKNVATFVVVISLTSAGFADDSKIPEIDEGINLSPTDDGLYLGEDVEMLVLPEDDDSITLSDEDTMLRKDGLSPGSPSSSSDTKNGDDHFSSGERNDTYAEKSPSLPCPGVLVVFSAFAAVAVVILRQAHRAYNEGNSTMSNDTNSDGNQELELNSILLRQQAETEGKASRHRYLSVIVAVTFGLVSLLLLVMFVCNVGVPEYGMQALFVTLLYITYMQLSWRSSRSLWKLASDYHLQLRRLHSVQLYLAAKADTQLSESQLTHLLSLLVDPVTQSDASGEWKDELQEIIAKHLYSNVEK